MEKECNHNWKELQRVNVFDNCDERCPKEIPNDHGHQGRIGLLVVCINCEKKKVLGENMEKINVINLI